MATQIWINIGSGKCLAAWRHQATAWTNVDLSSNAFHGIPWEQHLQFFIDYIFILLITITGLILGLHPANERRRYKVMPSLIGWAQT